MLESGRGVRHREEGGGGGERISSWVSHSLVLKWVWLVRLGLTSYTLCRERKVLVMGGRGDIIMGLASHTLCRERKGLVTGGGDIIMGLASHTLCRERKGLVIASFPGPTQLFVACSTEKRGEPGIFSHVSMT